MFDLERHLAGLALVIILFMLLYLFNVHNCAYSERDGTKVGWPIPVVAAVFVFAVIDVLAWLVWAVVA